MATKEDLYEMAVDLFGEGRIDEAIASYTEALELDPDYVDALHGLAMAYSSRQQYDAAIAIGKRVCELTPGDILAHTSLSMFYQRQGMIAEAEAERSTARMLGWKRQLKDGEGQS